MKFLNKKNIVIGVIILVLTIACIMLGNWINDSAYALENSDNIIEYGNQEVGTSIVTDANHKEKSENEQENIMIEDNETTSEQEKVGENLEEVSKQEQDNSVTDGTNNEDIKMIFKQADSQKIYVYITGEVNNPGVVALNEGSRIVDAIEVAGGVTENANISKVNLVYCLLDGMKVNIPSDNDLKKNANFEYITMSSGDGKLDENISVGTTTDEKNTTNSNDSNISAFKQSIVNINTATQTELETLPGIGPSIALNIINYRKENGKFTNIEDIKNVSGIGDSKFKNIKNYIVI